MIYLISNSYSFIHVLGDIALKKTTYSKYCGSESASHSSCYEMSLEVVSTILTTSVSVVVGFASLDRI